MTPLKPYTAFPSKVHPESARTTRYEIRRTPGKSSSMVYSTRSPCDQPTRGGYTTTYRTREQAQAACDRMNAPNGACVVISVRKEVLAELIECERGSWDDINTSHAYSERSRESHVFTVAQRSTSRLIIRTREEAEDAYYAVCSGTFQSRSIACWRAAVRIADALREFADPKTVAMWPKPYEKPEGL